MEYLYIICWDEYIEWSKKSSWYTSVYAKNVNKAINLVKDVVLWDLCVISIYREDIPWLE